MATIVTKHEDGTSTDVPVSLTLGELAVNTQAGKLWVGNSVSTPIPLLGAPIATGTLDGQLMRWEAATNAWEATSAIVVSDAGDVTLSGVLTADVPWSNLSATPTTLLGYGITDAYTKTQVDALTWDFATDITSKPTTLAGYGITDAATFAQGALADTAVQPNDDATLNSLTITTSAVAGTQTISTSGNTTLDFATYQNFVLTLTGNVTLDNPTTEAVGQSGFITFIQDGTGGRTVSLGTDYETVGGGGLTLSGAASTTDIVPYVVTAAGRILLGAPQLAFS